MKTDIYGQVLITEQELFEAIYSGKTIDFSNIMINDNVDQFNNARKQNADPFPALQKYQTQVISLETFDRHNQSIWFIPDDYKSFDIEGYLVHVCPKQNYQRLIEELREFKSRNMINLLKWLKYFVETCNKNNIVHGVGRGSSVASYTLYLLGVHKIDSIKYKLDMKEFFKEITNDL